MKKLSRENIMKIEGNLLKTARPLEIAKWNFVFGNGTKNSIEKELISFQNEDGGFGSGLEIDTVTPESSALCASEAIKLSEEYDLDMNSEWVSKLMCWLEKSAASSPSFWDLVPPSINEYTRMKYLNYVPDTKFTPHVCAIFAPTLIMYGTQSQQLLGKEIVRRCEDFIKTNQPTWHFEIMFLQRMYLGLEKINYEFDRDAVLSYLKNKVDIGICNDEKKWQKFVAMPLDFIQSPEVPWYHGHEAEVEKNINFLIDTLDSDGKWPYKESWETSSEVLRAISAKWSGYFAVKNVFLLKKFNAIELF